MALSLSQCVFKDVMTRCVCRWREGEKESLIARVFYSVCVCVCTSDEHSAGLGRVGV